ncbi:hypothetical protein D3Z58_20320 [Clostridiaceae bacterium]|nr:hypothetical protein [Clostridiaceae bacterium]
MQSFWIQILFGGGGYAEFDIKEERILLLCGAGILPGNFVHRYRIINSHPGYLPYSRGLDALKWAIVDGFPIGVTTHFLGQETDGGEILERRIVPVRYADTFHAVAQRVYETEIEMLVGALEKTNEIHEFVDGSSYPVHRRMPHYIEIRLMERFEELRRMAAY